MHKTTKGRPHIGLIFAFLVAHQNKRHRNGIFHYNVSLACVQVATVRFERNPPLHQFRASVNEVKTLLAGSGLLSPISFMPPCHCASRRPCAWLWPTLSSDTTVANFALVVF